MLIVVALMGVLLLGGAAIAVDLSADTSGRRIDQNASDAGALAGSYALLSAVDQTQEISAVNGAFDGVGRNEGWPSTWWTTVTSVTPHVSQTQTYRGYTVTVTTPLPCTLSGGLCVSGTSDVPVGSKCDPASTVNSNNCIEVKVTHPLSNSFGAFIGAPTTSVGGDSVAFHYGPGGGFPVALYADQGIDAGNQTEVVAGDVYAGEYYMVQSVGGGKGGVCVESIADDNESGHLLFGSPQNPTASGVPANADVPPSVSFGNTSCIVGGGLQQWGPDPSVPSTQCDLGTAQVPSSSSNGVAGTTPVCVINPPLQPSGQSSPLGCTPTAGSPCSANGATDYLLQTGCATNFNAATYTTLPAVIDVQPVTFCSSSSKPDLVIELDNSQQLACFTFVIGDGEVVQLYNKTTLSGSNIAGSIIAASNPNPSPDDNNDQLDTNKCTATSASTHDIFWSDPSSTTTINVKAPGSQEFILNGSIYMPNPNSTVNTVTNEELEIFGQAVVGGWNVQSGNHTNPVVTFEQNQATPVTETEELVK